MSLRSGKLPFLGSEDEFFTIRHLPPSERRQVKACFCDKQQKPRNRTAGPHPPSHLKRGALARS
jgi:hypothetical protein